MRLVPFYEWLIPEQTRQSLLVLQGAVALVLLIACVNVANLLLARGAARQKEFSIRVAVGASRGRILWHGALESSLLAALGTSAGVALAAIAIRVLAVYASDTVPRLDEASIDVRTLVFAALCASVAAALFGLVPSLHAARDQAGQVLHDASRGSTGGRTRQRLRSTLTMAEVALSVALLIGAGLLLRSFLALQRVNPGFDVAGVMTGRVMLADPTAFDTGVKRVDFWRRMTAAVGALPGVSAVSTSSSVPLSGGSTSTELAVPGVPAARGHAAICRLARRDARLLPHDGHSSSGPRFQRSRRARRRAHHHRQRSAGQALLAERRRARPHDCSTQPRQPAAHDHRRRWRCPKLRPRWRGAADGLLLGTRRSCLQPDVRRLAEFGRILPRRSPQFAKPSAPSTRASRCTTSRPRATCSPIRSDRGV